MNFHFGCSFLRRLSLLIGLSLIQIVWGQTRIDLTKQAKNVDFSTATLTKPIKSGAALPAACTTGEYFFLTTAAPGANTFACIATNTWSLQGGVTAVFGRTGTVTKSEGDYNLADLGDVSAAKGTSGVVQMFGGGTPAASDCAMFDSAGNIVSAGAPCGSGGGGGTVNVSAGFGILTSSGGGTTVI